VSVLLFIVNAVRSRTRGEPAGDNPWGASTLEWATRSPAPSCNFTLIPVVSSQEPLWEVPRGPRYVTGLSSRSREVVSTSVLDAQPDHRYLSPRPTIWPFVAAVATTAWFIWSIFQPRGVVLGLIPVAIAVTAWFWPNPDERRERIALEKRP
jgi:cytochrome c oxidase subunit 1